MKPILFIDKSENKQKLVKLINGSSFRSMNNQLNCAINTAKLAQANGNETSAQQWILGNSILLKRSMQKLKHATSMQPTLPSDDEGRARLLKTARGWMNELYGNVNTDTLSELSKRRSKENSLTVAELDSLQLALSLVLLEQITIIANITAQKPERSIGFESKKIKASSYRYLQKQAQLDYNVSQLIKDLIELEDIDVELACTYACSADCMLRKDSTFNRMDRASRGIYRLAAAEIARKTDLSEDKIVEKALEFAQGESEPYKKEVGYYLIDDGKKKLFNGLNKRYYGNRDRQNRAILGIAVVTVIALLPIFIIVSNTNAIWIALLFFALGQAVGQDAILRVAAIEGKKALCALDYSKGIPSNAATAIVMPVLLTSPKRAVEVLQSLESLYLANRSKNLVFIMLGDYKDSKMQHETSDAAIVRQANQSINELNAKYGKHFYYLQRPRTLRLIDETYMGTDRKRGALCDLTRLLLHKSSEMFEQVDEDLFNLEYKYMLTLDADTKMQPDGAAKMIGTIMHPLNRAYLEEKKVVRGYGILQPIVRLTLKSVNKSLFAKGYSSQAGVDSYASASNDGWFRYLGKSAFTGKGLIDLMVFKKVAIETLPEGRILSHDLIEGALCRVALCDRTQVLDDCIFKYTSWVKREHRWIRGDWQLLPFIGSKLELQPIDRYRMIDNLIRTIKPLALLTIIMVSAAMNSIGIFIYGLLLYLMPFFITLGSGFCYVVRDENRLSKLNLVLKNSLIWLLTLGFELITLPHRAYAFAHAAICAVYRAYFSRKKLLEWVPAADMDASMAGTFKAYAIELWPCFVAALGLIAISINWWIVSVIWALAPVVAWAISKEIIDEIEITDNQRYKLGILSRKTWKFFDRYINEKTNYLPPDNYQFSPKPGFAMRTSPTNIGYALLAYVCAKELGYITKADMCYRITKMLDSIESLDTNRGHLYNWYDIGTCEPLLPKYVSTVDSGNLVCAMMTVKQAVIDMQTKELAPNQVMQGILHLLLVEKETRSLTADEKSMLSAAIKVADEKYQNDVNGWQEVLSSLTVLKNMLKKQGNRFLKVIREINSSIKETVNLKPWIQDCWTEARIFADSLTEINSYKNIKEKTGMVIAGLTDEAEAIPLCRSIKQGYDYAKKIIIECDEICDRLQRLINRTNFAHLYDVERALLYIGMDCEGHVGKSHYDLYASESRLTSIIAMAKGDIPYNHYASLGRIPISFGTAKTLVSWSGTMFEYLMPSLFLDYQKGSLASGTDKGAIAAQKKYARKLGLPFGMSESGYYAFDRYLNYQYKAFGVPDISLKSGLGKERVIAPYATIMAAAVDIKFVEKNFDILERQGAKSEVGYYEAIDYTTVRIGIDKEKQVVKSAMAHHQGMSFCALTNLLQGGIVKKWFSSEPGIQAISPLFEEKNVDIWPKSIKHVDEIQGKMAADVMPKRVVKESSGAIVSHLLSGGNYCLRITATGGGMSLACRKAINRWRNDPVLDEYGMQINVQASGKQPVSVYPEPSIEGDDERSYVEFLPHVAKFKKTHDVMDTKLDVFVCPEPDAEVRLLTIENTSNKSMDIQATCAFEPILCRLEKDVAHPAFSSMFLECASDGENEMLLCKRRRQTQEQSSICIGAWVVNDRNDGNIVWCLDREQWYRGAMGRVSTKSPHSIMAWGIRLKIKAHEKRKIAFVVGANENIKGIIAQRKMLSSMNDIASAKELSYAFAKAANKHIGLYGKKYNLCQRLSVRLLYCKNKAMECRVKVQDLWCNSISGDVPIVLSNVYDIEQINEMDDLFVFYRFWLLNDIEVDLVIINRSQNDYYSMLSEALVERAQQIHIPSDNRGGVHILSEQELNQEIIAKITTAASVVLNAGQNWNDFTSGQDRKKHVPYKKAERGTVLKESNLLFDNSIGGFNPNTDEYIITIDSVKDLPAVWTNVLSNKTFGSLCMAQGLGYTWNGNSRQKKLTAWHNDNVEFKPGEAIYVWDKQTDQLSSLTPLPVDASPFKIIIQPGSISYEGHSLGVQHVLTVWVDPYDSVKHLQIDMVNDSSSKKELRICYFADWVMGVAQQDHAGKVLCEFDQDNSTIIASSAVMDDGGYAFMRCNKDEVLAMGDRAQFLGLGKREAPSGIRSMERAFESVYGCTCGVIATDVTLEPSANERLHFVIGYAEDERTAIIKAVQATQDEVIAKSYDEMKLFWQVRLSNLEINTPNAALNVMTNKYLPYQVSACRLWARTAAYQAGGAFGFRDQLQDVLSLLLTYPEEVKAQIINSAAHQFIEGDVQHWWHPKTSGVRTHISDDLLFLPYVTSRYVETTQDLDLLKQQVNYLDGCVLDFDRADAYFEAGISEVSEEIYLHCLKAIDCTLNRMGEHGLPLMLGGDWNDGMNEVGRKRKGESIWLAFFLYKVLIDFSKIAFAYGEKDDAKRLEESALQLKNNINKFAWDRNWYLRAFYDDGTKLGSSESDECKIDCIAQAWAAISKAVPKEKAKRALDFVEKILVDKSNGILKLFSPPFDNGEKKPGYIRGYIPGVRENGGQYTHGALWVCLGLMEIGEYDKAYELLCMFNPVERSKTSSLLKKYKGEPYVLSADVYSLVGQEGRAGWSWYTGAASWMLQCIYYMLGINKRGNMLIIEPRVSSDWKRYSIEYKYGSSRYFIDVECVNDLDARQREEIELIDDDNDHRISIKINMRQA